MTIASSTVNSGTTTNDASIALTFTSSEATTTFAEGNISVSGGTLSAFATTSDTEYTATFTPSADGAYTIDVAAGGYTDAYGNANLVATQFTWTFDSTSPIMTIASTTAGVINGSSTGDDFIYVMFTSNEATSTFTESDIIVSNGSLSNF